MVVAPLGGAIMAFAGALVTGRTRWVWISFAQVALGALMTIVIGYLVSAGVGIVTIGVVIVAIFAALRLLRSREPHRPDLVEVQS